MRGATHILLSSCLLPTHLGTFRLDVHRTSGGAQVPVLFRSTPDASQQPTNVRVHDGCFTSEVLGSTRCDCAEQLSAAMRVVQREGGLVVHLPHNEGRGIGLANKVDAYRLQDEEQLDTYEANVRMGLEEDARTYECVPDILQHYGVDRVRLLTNSRVKLQRMRTVLGPSAVVDHRPVVVRHAARAASYLRAKSAKSLVEESPVFATEAQAVAALRGGQPVVVVDDDHRENEGDLIISAQHCTPEWMAFFVKHTSGVVCCAITRARAEALELPPMVAHNEDVHQTAFTVSVDLVKSSTGISARERAATCQALADGDAAASDFVRPGHVFPLVARDGGLRERRGHTEAGVHLCKRAGLAPAAVLSELTTRDALDMARLDEVWRFAREHDLLLVRIADLQHDLQDKAP